MRIALAQTNIIWEDKIANQKTASKMINDAALDNSDIIIFPEMSLTGFSMNIDIIAEHIDDSPTINFFSSEAKKHKIFIAFGLAVIEQDGKIYNKCIVVNDNGDIVSQYSKIHPFSFGVETKYFTGGSELAFFDLKGVKTSTFVCYDMRFPEIFQPASKECCLLLVIACWPEERIEHWEILTKARALENQCFIAGVNRTGAEMKYHYIGHSQIVGPCGKLVTEITEDEALIIHDINIEEASRYRQKFLISQDRRPEIYKKYL